MGERQSDDIEDCIQLETDKMAERRTVSPKRLNHHEAVNLPQNGSEAPSQPTGGDDGAAPSQLNIDVKMSSIRSDHRFIRQSLLSQEKRVRLRDYLFTARSSLEKNKQLKKQMKSKIAEQGHLKQSIQKLKKNKYQISNYEMHKIVKKEAQSQLKDIIAILREDLQFIEGQDLEHVSNEDLTYFYEVRKIVLEKIRPSINEMKEANLRRQKNIFQQMFNIGKSLAESKPLPVSGSQKLETNSANLKSTKGDAIKIVCHDEKHEEAKLGKPVDLVESIFMGRSEKN